MQQHSGNVSELADRVIAIKPHLAGQEDAFCGFCRLLVKLIKVSESSTRDRAIETARSEIESFAAVAPNKGHVALQFACSVVLDVVAQGWEVAVVRGTITLRSPQVANISPVDLKQRIRAGHLLERDAQLRQPSVREFIKSMEQRRLVKRGWVSIFSLMRDGRDLAPTLEAAAQDTRVERRLELLHTAISPYLQVVEADATCDYTGLKLMDVWRYFRHTWVNSYKSLPGRSMAVLVRDAAAPNHPVIGIAALGSSMAQQTLRDRWIGWEADIFEQSLCAKPTARLARWAYEAVDRLVNGIYKKDLLADGIIERRELRTPTERAIKRLLRESERSSEEHRRFPDAAKHKNASRGMDWKKQATSPLFRAKRSRTLALLLGIRAELPVLRGRQSALSSLKSALKTVAGRHALRQLVRLVKSEHVGVDMMDIIICGAVAPYNALLGGKLICLLLASPEIVRFYRDRYQRHESIIASSTRGAAVTRTPNLVLLATTSLYGAGSSQYNRLKVPLEALGEQSESRIEYINLGISKGYGSYHFSQATIDYLETLLGRAGGGRKVNSIFGEGVNPLMRKLRDGLAKIGFPTDDLLRHGNPRVVYCVPLASNFREVLLGLSMRPTYLLNGKRPQTDTAKLAYFWCRRWLAPRVLKTEVIEQVAQHSLSYPITHGARVKLPPEGPGELFE